MRTKTDFNKSTNLPRSVGTLIQCFFVSALILAGIQTSVHAQDRLQNVEDVQYKKATWRFGVAGGANFNFYQGTTQRLNDEMMTPQAFGHGSGIGLFVAPMVEYHRPGSLFGFMLQAGYDSRRGDFDQVTTPCNCPADLSTDLSYVTIEPSIRMEPFRSNFYVYAGPRLAFGLNESFEYDQGVNPDFPDSSPPRNVTGDFSEMEKNQFSFQIGTGLDIPINSTSDRNQYTLSPYITYHPYIGQSPRSIETWNVTTIRAGFAIKFGRSKRIETEALLPLAPVIVPSVRFTVDSPANEPADPILIELFPLRNYVFFDQASTTIPGRYNTMNKAQATKFKEDPTVQFSSTESASRQMTVYYNILNILGDRMAKNPTSSVTLVGSSENGVQDARQKAESVKAYLTTTFGINASRITTEGLAEPKLSSIQRPGRGTQLVLLRQENSRVSIESRSPELLMDYKTGHKASVTLANAQEAPLDSYVTFNVEGATKAFKSWKIEVKDDAGKIQNFGPYTENSHSLPGKDILGDRLSGTYKVTMIGEPYSGKTVRKETTVKMKRWEPTVVRNSTRYSVIYEFDDSSAKAVDEKYLTDVVTPAIPAGATVSIRGYTDNVGDAGHNLRLSEARANNVRNIIQSSLTKAGRTDVTFDVKGHGQDTSQSRFGNTYPEERFYNRGVTIDIIPAK